MMPVFALLAFPMMLFGQLPLNDPPEPKASILVVDEQGNYLPYGVTSCVDVQSGKDFAARFRQLHAESIPYGKYRVTLDRPGDKFNSARMTRELEVNRRRVYAVWEGNGVFVPGVAVSWAPPVGYQLRIRVSGSVDPGPMVRIRLASQVRPELYDCILDESRSCEIRYHLRGLYVVSVIQGTEVLHTEALTIGGGEDPETLVVALPAERRAVRVVR